MSNIAVSERKEEAIEAHDIYLAEPVLWAKNVLGIELWTMQRQILEAIRDNERVAVRSCFGSGKTYTASIAALWFLYNFLPSTVVTTAPTGRQVKEILWREIAQRFGAARFPLDGDLLTTQLTLDTKWFAIGMSTDNPEAFQGLHNKNVLAVVDEASGVSTEIFTALENPMASGNAHLLLIGNPTQQTGGFRDAFKADSGFKTFHISAFDTPNFTELGITRKDIEDGTWMAKQNNKPLPYPTLVSPEWVAGRYKAWGPGSYLYQVRVEGEFPQQGVNNLFALD
ncbi:hypothetical protein LCGC14_2245230, partial [marine sediment metagenome]